MLFAFSIAPATTDDPDGSVSASVAKAIDVVRRSGVTHRTDAMFTTLEGEWDECMAVIKECSDVLLTTSPRVSLVIKADLRPGRTGELDGKLERLNAAIDRL
ncbi:MAG: thiamine-binding protein [Propionibacteriales bacterium]|nr:thiamine-binding protein [Propionibacteriales bacterium]